MDENMRIVMDRIVAEKLAWRRRRAALPFVEKIRILVELQKRRAIIRRARGLDSLVWDITLPPPEPDSGAYMDEADGGDGPALSPPSPSSM